MVRITVKKTTNAKEVISKCYKTDAELIQKYHVLAPTTLEEAENHTSNELQISIDNDILTMYELSIGDKFVGYFGKEMVKEMGNLELLTGFFILPEYRTKEVINKFWKIVSSKFNKTIFTYLYEKNTRAINFVKKRGFKQWDRLLITQLEQYATIYRYN